MGWDKLPLTPEDFFGEAFDTGTGGEGPFEAVILPLRELVVYPQMVTPLLHKHWKSGLMAMMMAQCFPILMMDMKVLLRIWEQLNVIQVVLTLVW